jgi:hypoxanthine phosphoribosyltransferase
MKSYDYGKRRGVEEISWQRFADLSAKLAEMLHSEELEIILGIARAGLFPATAVACALRREFYPVRVTRRFGDQVKYERPVWRVDVPSAVAGKRVALIDEIADSGETLALVAGWVSERGASRVITASLVSHSWADPMPQVTALVSDALIIFPWDRQVYLNGEWQIHPELAAALKLQNGPPEGL